MSAFQAYVGLDVHRDSISVAVANAGRSAEVRSLSSIPNTVDALNRIVHPLAGRYRRIELVQGAGPCGYNLHRRLEQLGQTSRVIAPSRTRKRAGYRIKNDTPDALMLACLLHAGALEVISVPDVVHEAVRDLVRALAETGG